ncbi:MAG: hypothetical protein ACRDTG_31455 [Pseudonocardiaceae bacterium]
MPTLDHVRHRSSTRPSTVTRTVDGRDHLANAPAARLLRRRSPRPDSRALSAGRHLVVWG